MKKLMLFMGFIMIIFTLFYYKKYLDLYNLNVNLNNKKREYVDLVNKIELYDEYISLYDVVSKDGLSLEDKLKDINKDIKTKSDRVTYYKNSIDDLNKKMKQYVFETLECVSFFLYNSYGGYEMKRLVIVRHGQSVWNLENRFTGWTDVELSDNGVEEAKRAGRLLKERGYHFDIAFTSVLKRANDTLKIILEELGESIPIKYSYKLNERHYGALQGLNKDEMRVKYGEDQVHIWRRSADVRPPALTRDDDRYPGNDSKYKDLKDDELPLTECLLDTVDRVIDYWNSDIKKEIINGKNVIIVAHGNSLRGLIKYLDNLSKEEIVKVEIDTGRPIVYELDDDLKPIRHYYIDE